MGAGRRIWFRIKPTKTYLTVPQPTSTYLNLPKPTSTYLNLPKPTSTYLTYLNQPTYNPPTYLNLPNLHTYLTYLPTQPTSIRLLLGNSRRLFGTTVVLGRGFWCAPPGFLAKR